MNKSVLYMGDTRLDSAAAYLAGLMTEWSWPFQYLASEQAATVADVDRDFALYVLSDFPAERLESAASRALVQRVERGAGLLMIGGWESFHGCGGNWDGTPVGEILPVEISRRDDRVNCDQPALVRLVSEHPVTANLPWESRVPTIGGFNRFLPHPGSEVLLEVERFATRIFDDIAVFESRDRAPLLAVGTSGRGRVAALATDVAPHWVGGLVDWGEARVTARAAGAEAIEVGNDYARFFRQLLAWTGQLEG